MKVVVVGAGIAGLGAATYAAKKGHDVQVIEASGHVGGRAITLKNHKNGDSCDVGTQYYHSTYSRALGLIEDVGLGGRLASISGDTRFFDDRTPKGSFLVGHRLPWFSPAGVLGNLKMGWFLLHRIARHRMDTFALESHPELDSVAAYDVVKDPMLREFMVRTLHIAGGLAEPENTNVCLMQLMRLIRIIVLTDYLALEGGTASLHEALGKRLDVRLESPVERLVVEGGKTRGVELEGGEVVKADHVIVGATAPRAATMVPDEWKTEKEFLSGVRIPPGLIITFFLDRPLEKGVWSYFSQAGTGKRVSFCTDISQKTPAMVPSGNAVLQAWIVFPAADSLVDSNDDTIIDAARTELEDRFDGFSSWIEAAYVTRHQYGVPWHPVGHHSRAIEFMASADERPGVSFVGDYFSGGYLEPALWSAERAAARLG